MLSFKIKLYSLGFLSFYGMGSVTAAEIIENHSYAPPPYKQEKYPYSPPFLMGPDANSENMTKLEKENKEAIDKEIVNLKRMKNRIVEQYKEEEYTALLTVDYDNAIAALNEMLKNVNSDTSKNEIAQSISGIYHEYFMQDSDNVWD